jgi:hypothetical protein
MKPERLTAALAAPADAVVASNPVAVGLLEN